MAKKSHRKRHYGRSGGIGAKFVASAIGSFIAGNWIASMLRSRTEPTSTMPLIAPLALIATGYMGIRDPETKKGVIGGAIPSALLVAGQIGILGPTQSQDPNRKTAIQNALFLAGEDSDPLAGDEYVISGDENYMFSEQPTEMISGDDYVISGENADPLA